MEDTLPPVSSSPPTAPQRAPFVLSPRQRDWLLLVAYLHLEQHKADKACTLLRLAFQSFPEDAEVQRCLALAELLGGSPVASARAATRAFKQATGALRIPVGLVFAKALWEQGKHEAARDFLSSLLTDTQS